MFQSQYSVFSIHFPLCSRHVRIIIRIYPKWTVQYSIPLLSVSLSSAVWNTALIDSFRPQTLPAQPINYSYLLFSLITANDVKRLFSDFDHAMRRRWVAHEGTLSVMLLWMNSSPYFLWQQPVNTSLSLFRLCVCLVWVCVCEKVNWGLKLIISKPGA